MTRWWKLENSLIQWDFKSAQSTWRQYSLQQLQWLVCVTNVSVNNQREGWQCLTCLLSYDGWWYPRCIPFGGASMLCRILQGTSPWSNTPTPRSHTPPQCYTALSPPHSCTSCFVFLIMRTRRKLFMCAWAFHTSLKVLHYGVSLGSNQPINVTFKKLWHREKNSRFRVSVLHPHKPSPLVSGL